MEETYPVSATSAGRDIAHMVEKGIAAGNRLAFSQSCTYPGRQQPVCSTAKAEKSPSRPSFRPGTVNPMGRSLPNRLRRQSLPGTKAGTAGSS
jgi:hypothetical protein